jgi:putative oxidoreductase
MKIAVLITRLILGLVYLVFGLNFFFPFLHMAEPAVSKAASGFEGGLFGAGYFFPFLKSIEVLSGILLLVNRYTALVVLVIFPITLNIFLFHAFLVPSGLPIAAPMFLINLFLGYAYFKYYAGFFVAKPTVD